MRNLRVRDRAKRDTRTASDRQATLQRLLYSGKVHERFKGNETSKERETKLQRMRDRLAAEYSKRDIRLQQASTNQYAKLAVETS